MSGTLPSTEQSTLTATVLSDAVTVNRSMNTTIGTAQTSNALTTAGTTSVQNQYFTRFVSFPINTTSVAANTWTYNFAGTTSNVNANFPVSAGPNPVHVHCYIWRPSTGAKVGTILDGDSNDDYDEGATALTIYCYHGTFAGTAVTCQAGDVIIFEVWFAITQNNTTVRTNTFYYDGTTANTTGGSVVSNHASFIETPQTITQLPSTVDMTVVTTKVLVNKFITRV